MIRVVVLLLVLVNLGYFAWAQWIAPTPTGAGSARSGINALPRIELASRGASTPAVAPEVPAQTEPERVDAVPDAQVGEGAAGEAAPSPVADSASAGAAAAASAAAAAAAVAAVAAPVASSSAAAGGSCITIGPFDAVADADTVKRRLDGSVYDVRRRAVATDLPDGYIVMIRGLPTRAAQQRAQRRLRQGGLTDAYPLPALPDGFAVSIGLFSEKEGAERRAAEARTLGFEPEVNARRIPGSAWWVDVRPGTGSAVQSATSPGPGSASPDWELAARQRVAALSDGNAARLLEDKQVVACP
jgi:hypothetical protein